MRAFSTAAMAALVIVALFWGNCLSCPQVLNAHTCCHKSKAPAKCDTQSLQHFVKTDSTAPAPVLEAAAAVEAPVETPREAPLPPLRDHHGPPDILSLESSLRI